MKKTILALGALCSLGVPAQEKLYQQVFK